MTVEEFADRLIKSLSEWQIASQQASQKAGEEESTVAIALYFVAQSVKEAATETQEDNHDR